MAIRCRPAIANELKDELCVQVNAETSTVQVQGRRFAFDRVFGVDAGQDALYIEAARSIVDSVLEGYNGTIFAYGQTGTGKTYTQSGIIDNSFDHIFDFISTSAKETQFLVRASYYEIYNEEIRDLLRKDSCKSLELKETTSPGQSGQGNCVYVRNLSCYVVNNVNELQKLKLLGEKNRAIASTNINVRSSRSHTVFTITIEMIMKSPEHPQGSLRVGKLNLVDLAGSERQSKTGTAGDRLKEAAKINLSLTSLSLVIAALTDPKSCHIPYRNSKLTRILSDSLGGNSKTLLIACICPCRGNVDETLSTLRFASTAKKIKNKAVINEDSKDALLRKFQEQILELKKQLEDADERQESSFPCRRRDAGATNEELQGKLELLEQKIMVGGENLLEKAEQQERQLAETEAELEASRNKELQLKSVLEQKDAEILKIEESYESLQEEVAGLNKKLIKVLFHPIPSISRCKGTFLLSHSRSFSSFFLFRCSIT